MQTKSIRSLERIRLGWTAFLLAMTGVAFPAQGTIYFVDDTAQGANDGSSWVDAFVDLQSALAVAGASDQVWVAVGTYYPGPPGSAQTAVFNIDDRQVYGGFIGVEATLAERAGLFDQTILSGDLFRDDPSLVDNAFEVVRLSRGVLDGFVLEGANANGTEHHCGWGCGSQGNCGGGGCVDADDNGDALIRNCIFRANYALRGGGALRAVHGLVVEDCVFESNSSNGDGGAVHVFAHPGPPSVFRRCIFRSNSAPHGGAVYVQNGGARFEFCTFEGNAAGDEGGAISTLAGVCLVGCTFVGNTCSTDGGALHAADFGSFDVVSSSFLGNSAVLHGGAAYSTSGALRFQSCQFAGNTVSVDGGAVYAQNINLNLRNCALFGNAASGTGGGVYNGAGIPKIWNSILWGNSDGASADLLSQQFWFPSVMTPDVQHSCIQGWTLPGSGNIAIDPLLADPDGADGVVGTVDDNLRCTPGSPCIDTGCNDLIYADLCDVDGDGDTTESVPWDVGGGPRVLDDPGSADDPSCGPPPIVDIGAYEFDSDCNGNGIQDAVDISTGASSDCNGDGIPDECEGGFNDCNGNGIPDDCDISSGTSGDCNADGVPDECELDCNGNGIPDGCETFSDCNGDGVPDECQLQGNDCDGDGLPDDCEVDCDADGTPDDCQYVGTTYCFGDGGAAPCPCSNDGAPGCGGCSNSTGGGAYLVGTGSLSAASDDLVLICPGVPPHQFGIFYMGGSQATVPFGDGLRCVGPGGTGFFRFPVQSSGSSGEIALGPGIVWLSHTFQNTAGAIDAGETWFFQAWFRDPAGPCGSAFNLSNGIMIPFGP